MSEETASQTPGRTTWMRRYTTDPALADEFAEFVTTHVFPARRAHGFIVEDAWLSEDREQFTWFVSVEGSAEDFDRAERNWEESEDRARIFAGTPKYVLDKDLRPVRRLV